jgi:TRAP-type C4-dicarboxylate transport system substrate-binding protein
MKKQTIKQYEKLITIYNSWWDSMPSEMQKEIREFYGEMNEKDKEIIRGNKNETVQS